MCNNVWSSCVVTIHRAIIPDWETQHQSFGPTVFLISFLSELMFSPTVDHFLLYLFRILHHLDDKIGGCDAAVAARTSCGWIMSRECFE